ncbi:MAG: helix-turn-helix domain-containing protein [Streptococcaceae bacterium]|nr:helix-turn-helix domain-containing protein [Streptococcaceae bacterium]
MARDYGEVFRELREAKNITLDDLDGGEVSPKQLARFENGQSDLSAKKLFRALKMINVSIEEFLVMAKDYADNTIEELFLKLAKNHYEANLPLLHSYLKKELSLTKKEKWRYLNVIMISISIHNWDKNFKIPNFNQKHVADYLLSLKIYGYYELVIFMFLADILNIDIMCMLVKKIIARKDLYCSISKNKQILIKALLNIAMVCIMKDHLKNAFNFLHEISLLLEEEFLHERNIFLYVQGFYCLKVGKRDEGFEKMMAAIGIWEQLGAKNIAKKHREFFFEQYYRKNDDE